MLAQSLTRLFRPQGFPRRAFHWLTQRHVWLPAALTLFVVWLRCRSLGYSPMWSDQSTTLSIALRWVHGGPLPLIADPSSSGLHNLPLVCYLYALALRIWPDPLAVVWLIALVNLLGLAAAAAATARVFGWRVAWWASLLFAVNPWAVDFGRFIWMPSFVPAFTSLLYACVLMYFAVQPRAVYVIVGALSLAAAAQTHLTALALIPVLAVTALIFRRRLKWWPLLVGAVLFALSFVPYLVYQVQTHFDDLYYMLFKMGGTAQTDLWLPVALLLDLLHTAGVHMMELSRSSALWSRMNWGGTYADALATILLGGAVVNAALEALRLRRSFTPRATGAFIVLLWLCLPLLAFVRQTHAVYNYYLLFTFPTPFVLIGLLGDNLYAALGRWLRRLPGLASGKAAQVLATTAFLPLVLVAVQQGRLDLIGENLFSEGVLGSRRVADIRLAISEAKQLLAARPNCQLVVLQEEVLAENSAFDLLKEFVDPGRVRLVEAQKSLLIPAPCAVYMAGVPPAPAWQAWLDQNTVRLADMTIHTPTQTWTFYDLPPQNRAQAVSRLQAGAPLAAWANGAQLSSLTCRGDLQGTSLTLIYAWTVAADLPPETKLATVHSGNYLLSGQNKLVAQVDGIGFDSRDWRPGDVFETLWELPIPADLPPGDYRLATAFYQWPTVKRIPLAGSADDLQVVEQLSKIGP